MNTLFSVIVPVYNTEKYIDQCIESILLQCLVSFELLLIDDGSTDNSGMICDNYAKLDRRISVVHQSNGGVSSARNEGLKRARGKYICFIDADDRVTPTYLSNLMQGDNDIVISGLSFILINNEIIENIPHSTIINRCSDMNVCYEELERMNLLNGPYQKRFKLSIIRDNNLFFDVDIFSGEDTLFVLSYLQYVNSISTVNKSDYFYRRESNTLSRMRMHPQLALRYAKEMYFLRNRLNEKFKVGNLQRRKTNVLYQTYLFLVIYTLYYQKIPKDERLLFLKIIYKCECPTVIVGNSIKNILSFLLLKIGSPNLSDVYYRLIFKILR